ncbi:MAG: glycosyltransferase family 2 protein [Actinomycetaceae bacterium]|nr:glycosyltransferase family 2 protein [Actinomycetaceae bacterium]MDO5747029.1 glycosyltransferase family 2 protein [Actinomycetaceae bacterium]
MKVSIIVPIYNVEDYLSQCLESIAAQTYTNCELILVDDGSTDSSLHIARASKTPWPTQIITQKNQGLSAARNTGIRHATGSHICFVDSDDIIHPRFIELMVKAAQHYPGYIPMVSFSRFTDQPSSQVISEDFHDAPWSLLNTRHAVEALYTTSTLTYFTVAVNKLFPIEMWKTRHFPHGKLHEDVFTALDNLLLAKGVCWIKAPLYHYRSNPESIMTTFSIKHFDAVDAYRNHVHTLVSYKDTDNAYLAALALLKTVLTYGSQIPTHQRLSAHDQQIFSRSLLWGKKAALALNLKKCSLKDGLFIVLFRLSPAFAFRLYRIALLASSKFRG